MNNEEFLKDFNQDITFIDSIIEEVKKRIEEDKIIEKYTIEAAQKFLAQKAEDSFNPNEEKNSDLGR